MKINRFLFVIFIILTIFTLSTVNASDIDIDQSDNLSVDNGNYDVLNENPTDIYVDAVVGYDTNDGLADDSSLKTIGKAISIAKDNDNVYLAEGVYSGAGNTRLTIDKSLNLIGSEDTVIDGENSNYIFNISDGVTVTLKNIKFINALKNPNSYSNTYAGQVYGAALSISNATVIIDSCSFIGNKLDSNYNNTYGGAISNFGDLTIINSYFESNDASSSSDFKSQGGSIYNNGTLSITNSLIENSISTNGAGIYNEGNVTMDNTTIKGSSSLFKGYGSAIYNKGSFTILDSIIEKNSIPYTSPTFRMYGSVYNNGTLNVRGTVFKDNDVARTARRCEGSSAIYNGGGSLNVTYSAFINNLKANKISSDVYVASGNVISLDNNWWGSNDDPTKDSTRVGIQNTFSTWLVFKMTPDYLKLNISETGEIAAMWTNNLNQIPQIDLFPLFNVTFTVDYDEVETKELNDGKATFTFDKTQSKSQYVVEAITVGDFTQEIVVDVGKIQTSIEVECSGNITFNETLFVNLTLTDYNNRPINDVVIVEFGQKQYGIDLTNGRGTLEINDLRPGNFTLKVIYDGDEDHFKDSYSKDIEIKKLNPYLSIMAPEVKVGEYGKIYVTLLPDDTNISGRSILYVDGERQTGYKWLYNGNNNISLPKRYADGEHNITIEYLETDNGYYYSAVASTIFKVSLYDSQANISAKDIKVGEDAVITIRTGPDDLEGEAILVINGHEELIYLDPIETNVTFSNLKAGTYNVSVYFDGYAKYNEFNVSTSFKVERAPSELDVNLTFDEMKLSGNLVIRTNPADCTGVVAVWVNYRNYTATLVNGEATIDIKLDTGSNLIFVNYEGDDYFDDSSWNTTVGVVEDVVLIGRNSTGWEYNEFDYAIRLIEENGVPIVGVNVTVEFNGEKHNITTVDNGLGYYTLRLPAGTYTISASYQRQTVVNTLTVSEIAFNVTSQDIVYGDVETIETSFDNAISGNVNFIISGKLNKTVAIADGKATCDVSGLDAGKYTVTAIYLNDYTSKQKSSNFEVDKANLSINVDIRDVLASDDEIITVSNLSDATGKLTFTVNGKTYEAVISNGESLLNLSKLSMGSYSLSIKYDGDGNHNNASYATVFYIKGLETDVIVTINDAAYGEDLTAKAVVDKDATGVVRFTAEDFTKDVEIKNGVAIWTFTGINAGSHNITAEYIGNNYYVSSDNATSFTVSKAESNIVLYVNEVYLNENIRIFTNLSANATGKVLYSMNGFYSPRYKPVVDSLCHWYISPLDTGNYTVIAVYPGDDNYYGCNTTFILNVTQKRSILKVEIDDAGINDRVTARITLNSIGDVKLSDDIVLKVNGNSYDISVEGGQATVVLGKLPVGNYTFEATYKGNANYSKASSKGKFEVKDTLLTPVLTANNLTKYYKGSGKLVVSLTSSNGKAIEGNAITVKVNGKTFTGVTDASGKASFDIDLSSGQYTAVIESSETRTYHSASAKAVVTVNPTVEGIDVAKLEGSNTLYYAIFSDSNGKILANKKVQLKVGSKSISLTTLPNGISRVNLDWNVGTYTIVAINPVTGEKATNTLFVYNYLMENKDLTKYYKGSKGYTVRAYGADGKPVGAGEIVKMKVNGKTYSVKTDKNGYATLKINLKPGKYTIKATYKKYTVSNKITVKSTLITKNLSKKKSKTTKYQAKLLNGNGKVLKGKKITFKFKGKTYTAKTNKKGIATITIKTALKVGKYKIYTSYGKLKMTNTITIKK